MAAPVAARQPTAERGAPFVVVLREGNAPGGVARRLGERNGIRATQLYQHALAGFAARLDRRQLAAVKADPAVAFVEPDRVIELASQVLPTGVDRVEADLSPAAGINGSDERVPVDIAIIDTGIDQNHPDLNVVAGRDCAQDGVTSWADGHGHGTFVAGIAAALDNTSGTVGVAPGARLWSVRVFDATGFSRLSWVVCGIDWVTSLRQPGEPSRPRIEVANMSLRDPGADDNSCGRLNRDAEHTAICRSVAGGTTYVVAAGNDRTSTSRWIPAAYNEVITVSALADFDGVGGGVARATCSILGAGELDDTFADFSNYGTDVDLIAPGKCIRSTTRGGGIGISSGTSFATPAVTGATALYLSQHPDATPSAVRTALRAAGSADWFTWTDRDTIHEPLLNVHGLGGSADQTAPVATQPRSRIFAGAAVTAGGSVRLRTRWSASDAGTGIAHYDLARSTDGGAYSRVALPAPRSTSLISWIQPGHRYRYRVDAWDHGANRSAYVYGPERRLSMLQSRHSSILYRGTWASSSDSGALGGETTYSTRRGATATLSFSGREVAWVAPRGPSGGRARVELDGHAVATVDLERSSRAARRIVFDAATAGGTHTLRITVLSGRVDVDAFLILR
jgi:subtilisin family serine protease